MISPKHQSNPVQHRLAEAADMAFIHASWSSSERANTSASLVSNDIYYEDERRKIDYLLRLSTTMIVHVESKPDTIIGFMVYQYNTTSNHQVIHYAFVKSPFRQYGILSNLIELTNYDKGIIITCEPNVEVFQALSEHYALVYDYFYFTRERFING